MSFLEFTGVIAVFSLFAEELYEAFNIFGDVEMIDQLGKEVNVSGGIYNQAIDSPAPGKTSTQTLLTSLKTQTGRGQRL